MPTSPHRWSARVLVLPALAAVATVAGLAACGSQDAGDPPGSSGPRSSAPRSSAPGSSAPGSSGPATTTTATTPATTSATGPAADAALFPLTIGRTGGIAGVQDSVVVAADGVATLTTRQGSGSCLVPGEGMEQLRDASDLLPTLTAATLPPTPDVADGFVVTLSTARGTANLTDPALAGATSAVGLLLRAAESPPTAGTPCY